MSNEDGRDGEIAKLRAELERLTRSKTTERESPFLSPDAAGTGLSRTPIFVACGIAALVVIGLIIAVAGHNTAGTPSGAPDGATASVGSSPNPIDSAVHARPDDEVAFVAAVDAAKSAYEQASNDMVKGGTRGQRKSAVCRSLHGLNVTDWTGVVSDLSTNSEGKGVLTIDLGDGTKVQTWNNAISDAGSDTLIESTTPLFNTLTKLAKGDAVKFSGSFFDDDTDCVRELSFVSLNTSMTNPAFLMRFTDVEAMSGLPSPAQSSVDQAVAPAAVTVTPSPPQLPIPTPRQAKPIVAEVGPTQSLPSPAQVPIPVPQPAPTQTSNFSEAVGKTSTSGDPMDCTHSAAVAPSLICGSAYLRGLDGHIHAIYRTLVSRASPEQKALYGQEQQEWISGRDACDSVACLTASYQRRLSTVTSEAWVQYNHQRPDNSAPTAPTPP